MRNIIILPVVLITSLTLRGQNLQLHYDFGADRQYFTSTLEMFKPDSLGSTFWFVDFDFNSPDRPKGISMAYWEISREFYIPFLKNVNGLREMALHFEYNDGLMIEKELIGSGMTGYNLTSTWLAGFSYPIRIGGVSFQTMALYRFPRGAKNPGVQFTTVWFQPLWRNRLLLTGFIDLWMQEKTYEKGNEWVFQTEPQVWYLINNHIAIGGEVEISKNFPFGPAGWKVQPTLGVKWDF